MLVKKTLRDRLVCLADFVEMILLTVVFLRSLPNFFLKVCLPTLFAPVSNFLLPVATSAVSSAAISSNSEPTQFAAGTIYLCMNGIAVLPITCASSLNPRPRCRPTPL